MNTTKPTWSTCDEAALNDLQQRRQAFFDDTKPLVRAVVVLVDEELRTQPVRCEQVVNAWIANANAIRDALAPFDSGVREGSNSTSG